MLGLIILRHLEEVDMTYFVHMKRALLLSIRFGLSALQLVFHAFLPFIFVNSGKKAVYQYNREL